MEIAELLAVFVVLNAGVYTPFVKLGSFGKSQITKYNYASDAPLLRTLYLLSLRSCIHECSLRKKCAAVNYKRISETCILLKNNSSSGNTTANSVYVERAHIEDNAHDCDDTQVYREQNRSCAVEECDPALPTVQNGTIYGNMNSIGSKLKVMCKEGYKEKGGQKYMTCLKNGTWDFQPECECELKPSGNNQTFILGDKKMDCPSKTIFDIDTCRCEHLSSSLWTPLQ